jgi:prolyl-tRNA synthetase
MKWSKVLMPTLKEVPSEAEAISHILMIRAGLIRKLTSGVYSYLPMGLKVLSKVETIIKQEMDKKGAQQLLMPAIQPADLWQKSGRFEALGQDMITFTDRHNKLNVLGPTHEEVITSIVKNEVNSYKQLPIILYQIQTKFRDEARPRFGIIRSREFIMKDAYSFDPDLESLNKSYEKMYEAYFQIFTRCGLDFIAVEADTGIMGGDASHEFMVLAENGEDKVVQCENCKYAASLDKAECLAAQDTGRKTQDTGHELQREVNTPGLSSVEKVAEFLKVSVDKLIKTMIYKADDRIVAVLVRGDHQINEAKLTKVLKVKNIEMADPQTIKNVTKGPVGFSGPIGLENINIYADNALKTISQAVVGSNKPDTHTINVNINNIDVAQWADIRSISEQDSCPKCGSLIKIQQAIEVGHVFKLGTKYTESLGATFLDENGKANPIIMGCYGIGVTRIIAAYIEQNFDEHGIIWSKEIAPFQVIVMPLNTADKNSMQAAEQIYRELSGQNVEVLLDDRNVRAGIKFKDADLIGIPLQVIVGPKNIEKGQVEVKFRRTQDRQEVNMDQLSGKIFDLLAELK